MTRHPKRFLPFALILLAAILYFTLGHKIIEDAYYGRSLSLFNQVIKGQNVHPLSFYMSLADRLFLISALLMLCVLFLVTHADSVVKIGYSSKGFVSRHTLFGLILVCIILFFHQIYFYHFTVDDAYISFQYARNLANGNGLVFNPGERVAGYTNFLLVVVEAIIIKLGLNVIVAVKAIGMISGYLILYVFYKLSRLLFPGHIVLSILVLLLISTNGAFAIAGVSGLETLVFTLLVFSGTYFYVQEETCSNQNLFSPIFFGLATLTRPEGFMFFTLTLIHKLVRGIRSEGKTVVTFARWIMIYGLFVVPLLVFQYLYYGDVLPNTFYAKTQNAVIWQQLRHGLDYLVGFAKAYGINWLLIAPTAALVVRTKTRWRSYLLFVLLGYSAYVVKVGGDWIPFFRFVVPVIPSLYIFIQDGLVGLSKMISAGVFARKTLVKSATLTALLGFALYSSIVSSQNGRTWTLLRATGYGKAHYNLAKWLKNNTADDATVALMDVGIIGYYSQRRVLDTLGLVSEDIARMMYNGENPSKIAEYVVREDPAYIVLVSLSPGHFRSRWQVNDEAIFRNADFQKNYHYLFELEHFPPQKSGDGYYLMVFENAHHKV